jgi:hypothetical protein
MPLLVTHVVVSVLGLGSILSIAVAAGAVRRSPRPVGDLSAWLGPLLRVSGWSLAAMLLTGVLMDLLARGAFHEWWWFRGSALLLILAGALHGQTRRTAHRLSADEGGGVALRRVERLAYGMTLLVAAIAALMEAKPF